MVSSLWKTGLVMYLLIKTVLGDDKLKQTSVFSHGPNEDGLDNLSGQLWVLQPHIGAVLVELELTIHHLLNSKLPVLYRRKDGRTDGWMDG